MTRGLALRAEEYRQLAAQEAELAKSAIANESIYGVGKLFYSSSGESYRYR